MRLVAFVIGIILRVHFTVTSTAPASPQYILIPLPNAHPPPNSTVAERAPTRPTLRLSTLTRCLLLLVGFQDGPEAVVLRHVLLAADVRLLARRVGVVPRVHLAMSSR